MILLKNGTILDGTGGSARSGDVWLDGDRVSAGPAQGQGTDETVDCTGLTIAPGFIDIHSHSDVMVLENDRAKADQGVTGEVVGNCGFSPYPLGSIPHAVSEYSRGILYGPEQWGWPNAKEYLEEVNRRAKLASIWSLVGHGSLRTAHAGPRQGPLDTKQVDAMEHDLDDALAAGACGFSTGFMYAPGSSAPREEVVRLLKVVARHGKIYATHMRSYSFQLLESIEEQLLLARETGVKLQLSHLQAVGRANWDKQRKALDMIQEARDKGIDVEFDIYPYLAGSTVLTQLLPQWALDGGTETLLRRLREDRARIAQETIACMAQRWEDVYVASVGSQEGQHWVGKNFAQISEDRKLDPVECVFRLLEEENAEVNMLSFNQSEDNLRQLIQNPLCTVISDGFYVKGRPHPRLYGTFPHLLGEMVREKQWMPLEEAVYRITGKPAARFGMAGRGSLAPGSFADVVVFDAVRIRANATYENPRRQPEGILHVFRNGVRTL
ncbi:MAG: amidohydrolase family protein [Bryobacterales bacterium]|nr:amidohydrolase family protein [Bryobacterales bacterium]